MSFFKAQFPNDLGKKRRLLDARFNEKDLQSWTHDFKRKAWKAGTSTRVGQPTSLDRHRDARKHALAEVPVEDIQRITNGGQVHFVIPSRQDLYILLNLQDLVVIGRQLELFEGTANHRHGKSWTGCCHYSYC